MMLNFLLYNLPILSSEFPYTKEVSINLISDLLASSKILLSSSSLGMLEILLIQRQEFYKKEK